MIQLFALPEMLPSQESSDIESLTRLILAEREKRLSLTTELMFERQKNSQLEAFIEKMMNRTETREEKKEEQVLKISSDLSEIKVGTYPDYIRKLKIKSYKKKLKKYRQRVEVSRDFKGRSLAAKMKPRFNGKFAKKNTQI